MWIVQRAERNKPMAMINLTHLHLAGRAYKGFAVLALEQFLRERRWKNGQIPPETIRNLEKAISFLELALKGSAIIKTAKLNKSFPSNFPAIRAHNVCTMAYELSDIKKYSFDKIINFITLILG